MPPDLHTTCVHTAGALTDRMLRFLECQGVSCKESTLGSYKIALKHFCLFLNRTRLSGKNLKKLTASDLTDFLIHLSGQSLVPYTKVNYLINVRLYLAWEAEQEKINPDILKALDRSRLPKVPEYLPKPLNAENDRALQNQLKASNSPYAMLFLLLRQTGLRISELINLPFNPVVINDKKESFLKVPLGKMNNERMLPLSTETIELIQKIKSAYPIRLNRCDENRLIGLKGSVAAVRNHMAYHFRPFVEGLMDQNKPVTFHRLRHSYATSLLSAGVSIVSIMKLLGHRRIEMSLRYAKITPAHLRNEYLKAIAVIENQNGLQQTKPNPALDYHPSEIIDRLKAYTSQSASISAPQRKNILRKFTRLKNDLDQITFIDTFKMDPLNQGTATWSD